MDAAVVVSDTVPPYTGSPTTTQIDAPADHHVVCWYAQFGANAPQPWGAYQFVTDGDDLITGVLFAGEDHGSAYTAFLVCLPGGSCSP